MSQQSKKDRLRIVTKEKREGHKAELEDLFAVIIPEYQYVEKLNQDRDPLLSHRYDNDRSCHPSAKDVGKRKMQPALMAQAKRINISNSGHIYCPHEDSDREVYIKE